MIKLLRFSILFLAVLSASSVQATHNRAGEITYVTDTSNFLSITATITTYTKASSIPADRDSLEICWGWESNDILVCEWVQRSNGSGLLLGNDIKKNLYIATHTFPAIGHYVISMTDPNRNGGILNVNPPSSDNVPFHLETTITIFNPQFNGFNNSPILYQPPIDIACINQTFIHNPNAYDQDGDSLSYELTIPLQSVGTLVPNYSLPSNFPSPNPGINVISINEVTGDLLWETPQLAGEYNIAIYIIEWRNGRPLDTMIRDMQITVLDCDNEPPVIETIDEICVIAGTLIDFEVIATDPNPGQKVRLTALGGPLVISPSPAQFSPSTNAFEDPPVVRNFTWQTTCEHISDQFSSVIFKATDNYILDTDSAGLSTLKTVRIKVVGPPPEDLQAVAVDEQINISWEKPYDCEVVEDDYFKGFSVWRRLGSNSFPPDTCDPGLDGKGYTRIANKLFDMSGGRYVFTDFDVERGRNYCYRIVGDFAQTSAGGFNFNFVESLASDEICVQLSRDIPLITNVDVNITDPSNGEIFVQWSTPDPVDLDTIQNPGPYTYEVWRAEGITNTGFVPIPGASFTAANFYQAVDTNYVDTGLDTENNAYTYRIAFYINGEIDPLGFTNDASSTFLNIGSTDETNILTWDLDVPWDNFSYTVYRGNNTEPIAQYDSIGFSNTEEYIDNEGLVNGVEYCYYVRGYGSYNIEGILPLLINDSQRECGIPLDTIPPCPPSLTITNGCEDVGDSTNGDDIINNLVWVNPMNLCEETDDVVYYNVYYAPPTDMSNFQLIYTNNNSADTTLMHNSEFGIAGCYAVTAIDTFDNESAYSNIVCVDNCPIYNLPNAFTPNGDGSNELFIPYPYRFVDRVEFNVFNIWGQLVYTSTNPDLGWDGKNLKGKDVAQGVYYYTCRVFENRVSGVTENPEILNGFIELLR
ncbi:MAG: gliding motility-associated C-terminal domain-containing protein [Saprospiraceae bacterium]